jgi:hypothetical protein
MNASFYTPSRARAACLLASLLLGIVPAWAQPAAAPGQAKKPVAVDRAAIQEQSRQGIANAVAQAKTGNVAAAEQSLVALNRTKPNTAAWRIETAASPRRSRRW